MCIVLDQLMVPAETPLHYQVDNGTKEMAVQHQSEMFIELMPRRFWYD
jgi:hypothetical protein